MKEKIGTAVLELTTESGGFFKDLDEVERRAGTLDKSWKETGKTLEGFGRQTSAVGMAITKMSLPLLALGVGAAKAAIDFESSFAGVHKTVDATEEEFAGLAHGFRNMSKEIPVNVNELNRIGEAAGQLGVKTENILEFTRVMAALGVSTTLSSEEAAVALAKLANITQMPQTEFGRLGSTLVALGNDMATNETAIVDFGLRIAGAGKIAGLTEAQILAIGAAMSSVGVEAESGGTAVQKVLIKMTSAVATGGANLDVFARTAGMSAQAFATAFERDAGSAFAAFTAGIGTQGIKAVGTLEELELTDERLIKAFLSLGGAGDVLNKSLSIGTKSWAENTALAKESGERYKTMESQLKMLGHRFQDMGVSIGQALMPALQLVIRAMERLIPFAESGIAAFTSLPKGVQLGGIALAGLAVATGPVIIVMGSLITHTGTLLKIWPLVTNGVNAAIVRMGLMGQAATGLGIALWGPGKAGAVVAVAFAGMDDRPLDRRVVWTDQFHRPSNSESG